MKSACRAPARADWMKGNGRSPCSVPLQHITHWGACRKTGVMPQNRWPEPKLTESGDCEVRVSMAPDRPGHAVTPKTGHAVVIAGGGPTGLMLAGELALAGVDMAIVERRA